MAQVKWWTLLASLALAACQTLADGEEARALDGRPLRSPPPDPAAATRLQAELTAAEAAHRAAPADRDAAVWYGRRLAYLGRYREAIAVFTAALEQHPGDPVLLRHRGHRWLTVREFARAIEDLGAAAVACAQQPDAVEPDGQPVAGRPPHSTLHYNVHYHLGLAHFLTGDFAAAETSWLDCLAVAQNDESRVAVAHWLWSVRQRLGRPAAAAAAVAFVRPDLDVVENQSYLQLCRVYQGQLAAADVVVPKGSAGAALRFGLAHRLLVLGEREAARRQLQALAAEPGWAAFGVIAAEAELQRLAP